MQDYSASQSFPRAHRALNDLAQYGFLIKPSGPESDQFFPTHLATSLCSGDTASLNQTADEKKFIILETNYKIYAYTR
jgi:transcription initiation factor TFIIH subunit 4